MFNKKKVVITNESRKVIVRDQPTSYVSEQFRTTRTNINFSLPAGDLNTLLFTSSVQAEGKSTISVNLAHLFSQNGKRVLLIDCDMRKPTLHYTMGNENKLGLSNYLTEQASLQEIVHSSDNPMLSYITSGPIPPNPAELLDSSLLDKLITHFRAEFDLIIFDAPPVLAVTDAQILANRCDGTILVVKSGNTQKESAKKAKELLESSQAKLLGVVLNQYQMDKDHYYYYQYYGTEE